MQTDQINHSLSGSTHEGIAAPYDFEIMDVIKEAWQRTSGFKGAVLGAYAISFICLSVIGFAGLLFLDVIPDVNPFVVQELLSIIYDSLNFGITILSYPFFAGIMMMGIHRAVDAPVSYKMTFSYFSFTLRIILAVICMSVLIVLGFVLLVIPGIYLSIAYRFMVHLIIDKKMGVWDAMETSRKAVTQHWFKLFFTGVLIISIHVISAIPLGIGLIWTIPMHVAIQGILYRRIFGVESV